MQIDSVKEEKEERLKRGDKAAFRILQNAMHHWNNMQCIRDEGERCHRFVYGDQWSDKVKVGNRWKTEREALMEEGYTPRTVNLMNRVVKSITGVVLKNGNQPTAYSVDGLEQGVCDVVNKLIEANNVQNETKLVWPMQLKQFMEWGMMISKQVFGYNENGKYGCWMKNIDPREFFCDTGMTDIRGWDCNMVGMLHTLSLDDILASFAYGKEGRMKHQMICEAYGQCKDRRQVTNLFSESFGKSRPRNVDFLFPKDGDMCRLIEVWTKETKPRYHVHDTLNGTLTVIEEDDYETFVVAENLKRIELAKASGIPAEEIALAMMLAGMGGDNDAERHGLDTLSNGGYDAKHHSLDTMNKRHAGGLMMPAGCRLMIPEWREDRYWYYRFMTPTGFVIEEGETPYDHGSHPFVYVFYPFVLGDVRSYCADLIEENKNLNKDHTMFAQIMKHSMKGFTVYDKNTLPEEDPDGEHLMEVVAQPGGAYGFNLRPGEQIQQKVIQLSSNNTGVGLLESMKMSQTNIEDIGGVNGALQGKPGYSTTSGNLYQQQAQNATSSLLDVIESYYSFLIKNSYKQVSNMLQALDEKAIDKIAGAGSYQSLVNAMQMLNVDQLELDFKMVEGASSAVYRQLVIDYANNWLQMGFIDFKTYLQITNLPLTDRLLVMLEDANSQFEAMGQEPLPTRMPQQNVAGSVAGANAVNAGANNPYNRMAATRAVN